MSKKKILFLTFILLILIVIVGLLIFNRHREEPNMTIEPKISQEQALKIVKENFKSNNDIYKYDEKEGEYHIIKAVNNPSVEYWVHDNTGEILIQSGMGSADITNNE
ncbi:MAG: PepSY domain-containing protein [Bacilli bacterium]